MKITVETNDGICTRDFYPTSLLDILYKFSDCLNGVGIENIEFTVEEEDA